jgi:hypothetical protein
MYIHYCAAQIRRGVVEPWIKYISDHITAKKKGSNMHNISLAVKSAIVLGMTCVTYTQAQDVMKTAKVGNTKVELHVLAAEPFFTADEAAAKNATEGMLIVSGAAPLAPDAESHPNHHLVVHVFDSKTGKAITNAKIKMSFHALDAKGKTAGASTDVPIVVMQAIGKGTESTHYGNNVIMPAGPYSISVIVNGKKASFKIAVPEGSSAPMNMQ